MALFCCTLVTYYSCDTLSYNAISVQITIHKQATWHHFVLFVVWYHKGRCWRNKYEDEQKWKELRHLVKIFIVSSCTGRYCIELYLSVIVHGSLNGPRRPISSVPRTAKWYLLPGKNWVSVHAMGRGKAFTTPIFFHWCGFSAVPPSWPRFKIFSVLL